jgi:hypothetical protein
MKNDVVNVIHSAVLISATKTMTVASLSATDHLMYRGGSCIVIFLRLLLL